MITATPLHSHFPIFLSFTHDPMCCCCTVPATAHASVIKRKISKQSARNSWISSLQSVTNVFNLTNATCQYIKANTSLFSQRHCSEKMKSQIAALFVPIQMSDTFLSFAHTFPYSIANTIILPEAWHIIQHKSFFKGPAPRSPIYAQKARETNIPSSETYIYIPHNTSSFSILAYIVSEK